MKKNITYITYQTFPGRTANSVQTISSLKYFHREGFKCTLIYPLRNKESSKNINDLKSFYSFSEDIAIKATIHPLPFKKILVFEKYWYVLSHILWSYFTVKKYSKNNKDGLFFTRSEWVFYFLSKRRKKVVYECHQLSAMKKTLIRSSLKYPNSRLITLTSFLTEELSSSAPTKILELGSSYDSDFFYSEKDKEKNIVYAGSFFRFGETRGIEILINNLKNENNENLKFIFISPDAESLELFKEKIKSEKLNMKFEYFSNLNPREVGAILNKAKVGLLINNDSKHAELYSSPLKYFEYLASGLNVVATDLKTHRNLPFNENIIFYDSADIASFEQSLLIALNQETNLYNVSAYSTQSRVKKIINFCS